MRRLNAHGIVRVQSRNTMKIIVAGKQPPLPKREHFQLEGLGLGIAQKVFHMKLLI